MMADPLTERRGRREVLSMLVILLIGVAARCWHIGWGLPDIFEEATPFTVGWRFWQWGKPGLDFDPHFFNYPALTFFLNFLLQAIHYGVGHLAGSYTDLTSFGRAFAADPTPFVLASRLLTVAFDCATIASVYLLAKEYVEAPAALLPALLTALNPLLIRNAHLINVDTPLVFFCVFAMIAMVKLRRNGELAWYLKAGAAIGLAASSKYTGALLLPMLLFAHLLRSGTTREALRSLLDPRLAGGAGLAGVVFLLLNPYVFLNFTEFYHDFSFEESHMAQGHLGLDPRQSTAGFYLLDVLPASVGWIFLAVIACSLVLVLWRRRKDDLLLASFPLLYIGVLMTWKMRADRYLLPSIPPLIILGSLGMAAVFRFMKTSAGRYWSAFHSPNVRVFAGTLSVFMIVVQPVAAVASYSSSLSLPDTRTLAKEWILRNVPKGGAIVVPPFGLALPDSIYRIFPMPFLSVNAERVAPFYDTRWFDDFDLVVGSDFDYNRYLKDTARYREFIAYYDSLRSRYTLAYEAAPKDQQPGPALWLFRPRPSGAAQFDERLFDRLANMPESVWVSRFLKNLSLILMERGKYGKTEQVAGEILSVESTNIEVLRMLADTREHLGRMDAMYAELDTLIARYPMNGDIPALKGNLLLRAGRDNEAEYALTRALEADPRIESVYDDLLRIYVNRKDKKKAIDILTKHKHLLDPKSEKAKLIDRDLQTLSTLP